MHERKERIGNVDRSCGRNSCTKEIHPSFFFMNARWFLPRNRTCFHRKEQIAKQTEIFRTTRSRIEASFRHRRFHEKERRSIHFLFFRRRKRYVSISSGLHREAWIPFFLFFSNSTRKEDAQTASRSIELTERNEHILSSCRSIRSQAQTDGEGGDVSRRERRRKDTSRHPFHLEKEIHRKDLLTFRSAACTFSEPLERKDGRHEAGSKTLGSGRKDMHHAKRQDHRSRWSFSWTDTLVFAHERNGKRQ